MLPTLEKYEQKTHTVANAIHPNDTKAHQFATESKKALSG